MGGDYAKFPLSASDKAKIWRQEVNAVKDELGVSYKQALIIASSRRKEKNGEYKTTKEQYVKKLDDKRKNGKIYSPYGKKNKRPLSLDAAQTILLQYYRQRAEKYKNGPLSAIKKDISSCHKDPKKTLKAVSYTHLTLPTKRIV